MMRFAAAALLVASSFLAACEPEEPPPAAAPVTGIWHISRTVQVTAGTDCPTLNASDFSLVVSSGEVDQLDVVDNTLWDGNPVVIGPTHVWFETEELAFSENQNPVIISHDLNVVGDQLVGTGEAAGDGEYIDCHWKLDLVGTRQGESCKQGGCAL